MTGEKSIPWWVCVHKVEEWVPEGQTDYLTDSAAHAMKEDPSFLLSFTTLR